MSDKFPIPGDKNYMQFVGGWMSVKLKELKDIENPPKDIREYNAWLEEFDGFEQDIMDSQLGITKCTCGHKNEKHAKDCRIHPHYMIILRDVAGGKIGVPSLFLEPVQFLDQEYIIFENDKTENPAETEKSWVIENISEGVVEVKVSENASVVIKNPAVIFSKAEKKTTRKKYFWISASKDAVLKIVDIEEVNNSDIAIDEDVQEWISCEMIGKIGECVPLDGNDPLNGFEAVVEINKDALSKVMVAFANLSEKRLKQVIIGEIEKI